jgi:hypothetical protein
MAGMRSPGVMKMEGGGKLGKAPDKPPAISLARDIIKEG